MPHMNEKTRLLVNTNPTRIQIINKNEEDEAICHGYRSNIVMKIFFYLLVILSLGTIILLFYWKPNWKLYLIARKCDLSKAQFILIQDLYKRSTVVKVKTISNQNLSSEKDTNASNEDGGSYQSFPDSLNQSVSANDAANSSKNLFSHSPRKIQPNPNEIRYFRYHLIRYAWNQSRRQFEKIYGLDHLTTCHRLVNDFKGFPAQVQEAKMKFYGDNSIEVKVKSYVRLFFEEILTPFYIFQIMACALWIVDDYYLYAGCIIGISLTSIIISLIETKRQSQTLHDMVKTDFKVKVCRGGDEFEEVPCEQLVPGDIIEIPSNHASVMTCDAVLLNGTCILNESMLTGESVPVVKAPLLEPENSNEIYNVETHKRHTLFNGTKVVQTRNYDGSRVLAVVIRTGFSTAKGELVRGILFPKPMGFKFYEDSLKFILFLFCVAIIGMGYGIVILANKGVHVRDLVIRALDIVTIVVPPALPAAMTVGTVYAQSRLKKKSIYCISPPRINVGGKLKLICFDKTGTLTEDGLDIWGVLGVDKKLDFKHPIHNIADGLEDGKLLRTLATCHSLSRYEGALTGDPLDIKMFESTKWEFIDEPPVGGSNGRFEKMCPIVRKPKGFRTFIGSEHGEREEIAIVKQFAFSSALLRMSVICRSSNDDCMEVYAKGAPEKIVELCKPQTVPNDFHEILKIYTANGYRVIALAGKNLPSEVTWHASTKLPRDQVESDLDFYGLLIMQNAMKPETTRIISELAQADLTTLMVTGDNLLTALCVARKCGMVPKWNKVIIVEAHAEQEPEDLDGDGLLIARTNKVPPRIEWKLADETVDLDNLDLNAIHQHANHPDIQSVINVTPTQDAYNFAMTGKTFAILRKSFPKILERILVNGTVYARMSPEQKAQLVEHLISIGYCVSMCGDGANDTIALKAAHVGISLSEAEASVASPFTSKIQNISCVPEVIKEGRAALVTSFGVFKYMALYSMIQFISVLILYAFMTNLADQQFLYIDLLLITPVAVFMSANQAYRKLSKKRPLGSLVGFVNICSILFQIVLVLAFQLLTFFYLVKQPWYEPNKADRDNFKNNVKTMEGTAVFLISTYQYVIMAFVYSRGPPYRQSILHNFWFVFSLLVLTALNVWITLAPLPEVRDLLSMKELDPGKDISLFRINIVFIAVIFFILSFSIEELIVNAKAFKKLGKLITRKKHPKNKYKLLKQEIEKDPHWPYIGRITFENN